VFVESALDFSDEGDAPDKAQEAVLAICGEVQQSLGPLVKEDRYAERLRDGLAVLIAGQPNTGKSTLLNAIARRDVAIVTDRPGTTRDLIELHLDLGGYPVTLIDTAGIRASQDPVEQIGIERALKRGQAADLVLWLQAADQPKMPPPSEFQDRELWLVTTKADVIGVAVSTERYGAGRRTNAVDDMQEEFCISAQTGDNVEVLIARLQGFAGDQMHSDGALVIANERQRNAIRLAYTSLSAAVEMINVPEFLAEELRQACFALESLIGKVGVEDVLDQLFARFCIGK